MQIRENLDRCGSGTKEARERLYACVCVCAGWSSIEKQGTFVMKASVISEVRF